MSSSVLSRVTSGRGVRSRVRALAIAATLGGVAVTSVTSASALDEYTPTLYDLDQVAMIMQSVAPLDETKTLAGLPEFQATYSDNVSLKPDEAAARVRAELPKLRASKSGTIIPVKNTEGATVKRGISVGPAHVGTKDVSIAEYCTAYKDFCGFVGNADFRNMWPRVAVSGNVTGQGGTSMSVTYSNTYTKSKSTTTTNGWSLGTTFGGSGASASGGIEYSQSTTDEESFSDTAQQQFNFNIPNGKVGRVESRFNGGYYDGYVAVRESDGDGLDGNGDIKLFPVRHVLAPSSKANSGTTLSAVHANNDVQIDGPDANVGNFLKQLANQASQNAALINTFLESSKKLTERHCYAFVGCVN
ncbi:hypothetical protein ACWF95_40250 [Streptomyces vinaceus]